MSKIQRLVRKVTRLHKRMIKADEAIQKAKHRYEILSAKADVLTQKIKYVCKIGEVDYQISKLTANQAPTRDR